MSLKFPSIYLYRQAATPTSSPSSPLHFTGGPAKQEAKEEDDNAPRTLLHTASLPITTDEFKKAHPSKLRTPTIIKRSTMEATTTPVPDTSKSTTPTTKIPKASRVATSNSLRNTTRIPRTTLSARKTSVQTSTALVRTGHQAKQNDKTDNLSSSTSVTSLPQEEAENRQNGIMVRVPNYGTDGRITYTQTIYTPQQILDLYGVRCYPDEEPEQEKTIAASLQKHFQSKSKELARTLERTYNPNILLLSQDPKFKKPMLMALQKELGYKIPVINFNNSYLEPYDRSSTPFLETLAGC